jgi:hypothetical protein
MDAMSRIIQTFSLPAQKRIAQAVRRVEGLPPQEVSEGTFTPSPATTRYRVKIIGPRGPGKYDGKLLLGHKVNGKYLTGPKADISPDTALTEAELGDIYEWKRGATNGIGVLVVCLTEIGSNTNDLKTDSVWPCEVLRRQEDGRIVVTVQSGGGSLPVGQYQYMVYQMVSDNQAGWEFIMAHLLRGGDEY